jgi:hypothetical protein
MFTAYGLVLVTINIGLAIADIGKALDVLKEAAWLYSGLIFTTSATAAYIDRTRRQNGGAAPTEGSTEGSPQ